MPLPRGGLGTAKSKKVFRFFGHNDYCTSTTQLKNTYSKFIRRLFDGRFRLDVPARKSPTGQRVRERFDTEALAIGRAKELFVAQENVALAVSNITPAQALDATKALSLLANKYPQVTLAETAKLYLDTMALRDASVPLLELLNSFIAAKEGRRSRGTIKEYKLLKKLRQRLPLRRLGGLPWRLGRLPLRRLLRRRWRVLRRRVPSRRLSRRVRIWSLEFPVLSFSGTGLVPMDADGVLYRSVRRGKCQHFLWPIVGWRVDVARGQRTNRTLRFRLAQVVRTTLPVFLRSSI